MDNVATQGDVAFAMCVINAANADQIGFFLIWSLGAAVIYAIQRD